MTRDNRPRYQFSADRQSASRRLRYRETSHPDDGECTLCRLDTETEESPAPMSSSEDDEQFAAETLVQAIENQLADDQPPAARAVLNKLTLVGYPREESLQLMALALANEIRAMDAEQRGFDGQRYETLLRALPDLPDD